MKLVPTPDKSIRGQAPAVNQDEYLICPPLQKGEYMESIFVITDKSKGHYVRDFSRLLYPFVMSLS